jgi:undecaprenyl-diphosphatase
MLHLNILAANTLYNLVSTFDNSVYKLVSSWMSESLTSFMRIISFIGSGWLLAPIALATVIVTLKYSKVFKWGILIALNLGTVSLINYLIKIIIHRPRPDVLKLIAVGGFSFPSWHAMTAICFFGYFIYLIMKYFKHWTSYLFAGILGLLIFTIGIGRVYLGVHYASDVLCGYIFGLVWLFAFIRLTGHVSSWIKLK